MDSNLKELVFKYRYQPHLNKLVADLMRISMTGNNDALELMVNSLITDLFPEEFRENRIKIWDELLDFYSLLEIAATTKFIDSSDSEWREEARKLLEIGELHIYTLTIYRSSLPIQLVNALNSGERLYMEARHDIFVQLLLVYDMAKESESVNIIREFSPGSIDEFFFSLKLVAKYEDVHAMLLWDHTLMLAFEDFLSLSQLLGELLKTTIGDEELNTYILQLFRNYFDPVQVSQKQFLIGVRDLLNYFQKMLQTNVDELPVYFFQEESERIHMLHENFELIQDMIDSHLGMFV